MGKSAAYRDIKADDGGSKGPLGHLGSAVEWVLGLVLIGVVLINVVNATGRYLFSASMTGADELMVFIMIFVVMVGAVLALAGRRQYLLELRRVERQQMLIIGYRHGLFVRDRQRDLDVGQCLNGRSPHGLGIGQRFQVSIEPCK